MSDPGAGGARPARRYERCVVVGTGLIGASLAAAGRREGLFARVAGVGRRQQNLDTALARGLVDEVSTDLATALRGADLVVLATPVATAVSQLREVAALAPEAAITDVGSVKEPIVEAARRAGVTGRFLAAHPLAGKSQAGAAEADADLFRGRRVVLTPDRETPGELIDDMRALWRAVGAVVSQMKAHEHDVVLATSSHLPQMVAYALAATAEEADRRDDVLQMMAGGFRDTTRLASGDPDMWVDIARLNHEALVQAMDQFSAVWDDLRDAIDEEDEDEIRRLIAASRKLRAEIEPS